MKSSRRGKATGVLLAAVAMASFGCGSGSDQGQGQIVSSELPGTSVTKPEGDLTTGGTAGSGGTAGTGGTGTTGGTSGDSGSPQEQDPALVMQIINTVLE
jgi:hypothetical protein